MLIDELIKSLTYKISVCFWIRNYFVGVLIFFL